MLASPVQRMAGTDRFLLYLIVALLLVLAWHILISSNPMTYRNEPDSQTASLLSKQIENIQYQINKLLDPKQTSKEQAREKVMRNDIGPEDANLLAYVRQYEIHPPASHLMYKISHNSMIKSAQAETIDKYFKGKKGLYFMECGALDGERSSNTLWLEKEKGWRGVLIEMDPFFFMQLQGKNRKAHSLNICLSPKSHPTKMEFSESFGGLGSLIMGGKKHGLTSYCFPFLTVMMALNITKVDYFSLDVEGAEMDVLKTIPFDKIDITSFSVEYSHVPGGETGLKNFMKEKGYSVLKRMDISKPNIDFFAQDLIFVKD